MGAPIARISHYRVVSLLGRGGMGEVYRAVDERLEREVALKLLPGGTHASTDRQARFLREAKAAGSLNHPGIVTVYDVGAFEGRLFLAMELVDGKRFTQMAMAGVAPERALALCAEAADALAAAHDRGILHRDIKSDNLMVTRDGRVKVLDFGLAKLQLARRAGAEATAPDADDASPELSPTQEGFAETLVAPHAPPPGSTPAGDTLPLSPSSDDLTRVGALVGTPAYMAPEQLDGRHAGARTEVFSLGVVLYELFTGRRLFERDTTEATLDAVRSAELSGPVCTLAGTPIPPEAAAVLAGALVRDPTGRLADMRAFAAAARGAIRALRSAPRRRRIARASIAAAALFALVAGGAALQHRRTLREAPSPLTVTSSRRITFDPGCEEFPTLLPDARSLIYDGLVDDDYELLHLDIDSGRRTRLTTAPSWDDGPAVSPDGTRVAWRHLGETGESLMLARLDGERLDAPSALDVVTGSPYWIDDGALVVGGLNGEVVRWDLPARRRTLLAQLPGRIAGHVIVLPRDRIVASLSSLLDPTTDVVEILPGGRLRELDLTRRDEATGLIVAPSGRAFYYARVSSSEGFELVRRELDGDLPGTVVPGGVAPGGGLAISRDGHRLVYSSCKEIYSIARLHQGAAPVDLQPSGRWHDELNARVDDHRLLFTSDRSGDDRVWLLDLRTGDARPLTGSNSREGSVSPDGKWVVYADRAHSGIHVVPLEGGPPRRLTDNDSDQQPMFSHDGALIYFTRGSDGPQGMAIPFAGGTPRRIGPRGIHALVPSPVDDRVLLSLSRPAGTELLMTRADGADAPLQAALPIGAYTSPRFSRDGKKLLVIRRHTEIFTIDLAAPAAPQLYWQTFSQGIFGADFAPDGDGIIASLARWDGDLWLVDGNFP